MNAKLPEISAAIGLRQFVGFDRRLASRRNIFDRYCTELTGVGLRFRPNADASSLCFVIVCCEPADHRAAVRASLRDPAIQTRGYYNPPRHLQPYFVANPELARSANLPVTEDISSWIVSRPVYDYMASDDVARVVAAVQEGSS